METAIFIFIGAVSVMLYLLWPKRRLSDKIKKLIKDNQDVSPTSLAAIIADDPKYNNIPFEIAEEYCHRIMEDLSVKALDEKWNSKS